MPLAGRAARWRSPWRLSGRPTIARGTGANAATLRKTMMSRKHIDIFSRRRTHPSTYRAPDVEIWVVGDVDPGHTSRRRPSREPRAARLPAAGTHLRGASRWHRLRRGGRLLLGMEAGALARRRRRLLDLLLGRHMGPASDRAAGGRLLVIRAAFGCAAIGRRRRSSKISLGRLQPIRDIAGPPNKNT